MDPACHAGKEHSLPSAQQRMSANPVSCEGFQQLPCLNVYPEMLYLRGGCLWLTLMSLLWSGGLLTCWRDVGHMGIHLNVTGSLHAQVRVLVADIRVVQLQKGSGRRGANTGVLGQE